MFLVCNHHIVADFLPSGQTSVFLVVKYDHRNKPQDEPDQMSDSQKSKHQISPEDQRYALMSWKRFDDEVTDELLRAITSAFALIAVADGDLARSEIDQFMQTLKEQSDLFPSLDMASVAPVFRDLCGAMFADPEAGRQHALQDVAVVAGNSVHVDLVNAAAKVAVAADGRSDAREAVLLQDIGKALGIAEGNQNA